MQGMEMGFDGKTLIHPTTIELANEIYTPSKEDLDLAREVITEYSKAQLEGEVQRNRRSSNTSFRFMSCSRVRSGGCKRKACGRDACERSAACPGPPTPN